MADEIKTRLDQLSVVECDMDDHVYGVISDDEVGYVSEDGIKVTKHAAHLHDFLVIFHFVSSCFIQESLAQFSLVIFHFVSLRTYKKVMQKFHIHT
jgi:hypothetical protein